MVAIGIEKWGVTRSQTGEKDGVASRWPGTQAIMSGITVVI